MGSGERWGAGGAVKWSVSSNKDAPLISVGQAFQSAQAGIPVPLDCLSPTELIESPRWAGRSVCFLAELPNPKSQM